MPWYTTADARRDAEKQAATREQAGLTSQCSTFCAYEEEGRCAVTEDGLCDAPALRRMGMTEHADRVTEMEAPINVNYVDGVGAVRSRPEDCRDGISYVTVADTVYWPLSAEDAQLLRSAECGRGEFTGPTNEYPDASVLVGALEAEIERLLSIISDIKDWDCDVRGGFLSIPLGLRRRMQEAIDAHHKQQEPGND